MRVLAKLADYSEYLQRMGAVKSETHPKIDAQLINGYVNKVASKGRYTLTEIEGYDVREREACEVDSVGVRHSNPRLQAGDRRKRRCGLPEQGEDGREGQVRGEDRVPGCTDWFLVDRSACRSFIRATWAA